MTTRADSSLPLTTSRDVTLEILDEILHDFGLQRRSGRTSVKLVGDIPNMRAAKSDKINLPLIGTIPALANAIAATRIYEARGGKAQTIEVDVRKGHNYLDPNIGMTPTINGQEIPLDMVAGNPFLGGIYETSDGRHVVPSAVYVDLVYKWSTFLGCAVNAVDVAAAIKHWHSSDLELAAREAGLPLAVVQSEETWLGTPQGERMAKLPIVPSKKMTATPSKLLPPNLSWPLEGLKVLCATHAIAGPSAGRTLAKHGASVLQIMYIYGFEHNFVYMYANLGCAFARLDFHKNSDGQQMWRLVADADVWIDSYRDGALAKFGFTDEDLLDAQSESDYLACACVRDYGRLGSEARVRRARPRHGPAHHANRRMQ